MVRRPAPRPPARGRRAAAAVEFALVLPFLMVLVLGMFEIGRAIMVKEVLADAAQKGCRTGALPGKSSSDVTADVASVMSDNGIAGYSVTVLINGTAADASTAKKSDQVSVRVSVPVARVFWISTMFLSASSVVSETVVMMRQG